MFKSTPIRVLGLLGGLVGVFSATHVEFDTDPLNLLLHDMPEVNGLRLYQENFGQDIDHILTIEGDDPIEVEDATRSLSEALLANKGLVARADWQPPGTEDLSVYGDLLAYAWLNAPPAEFEKLVTGLTTPASTQAKFDDAIETLTSGFDAEDLSCSAEFPPPQDSARSSPPATQASSVSDGSALLASF